MFMNQRINKIHPQSENIMEQLKILFKQIFNYMRKCPK